MRARGISFVLAWLAAVPAARADDEAVLVTTASGVVRGQDLGTRREWRGIPYAAPPVQDLRWKPTAPPIPWSGVRDALDFGPHCLQPWWEGGLVGSEDCLYLNVSVPLQAAPGSNFPVIVDIHGGGDVVGWGMEDTGSLVRHDVIVVTLNYRLGVLGFLAHPLLTAEGGGTSSNYGLWDCIAALQWVKDNIAAFGGDPENVTLSGFSSGAGNGFALVAARQAQGLFKRAVLSSWEILPDRRHQPEARRPRARGRVAHAALRM
jgi:para-nitrobenzyl esterase